MKKQPKGSMCAQCAELQNDCTNYDFESMQVIEKPNIVKCKYYWKLP